jgi:Fur family ferric uptake transcriptional regulator
MHYSALSPASPAVTPSETAALAAQIRGTGARATPARIRVLQILRSAPAALTHHDIERALGALTLDRVTLYRVLDWLVEAGLAHKSTDARGVFRFSVAAAGEHQTHMHFRCDFCGRVFCLDAPPPTPPHLPEGFSLSRMDLDLRGCCAGCAEGTQ